jgi:hypothetical protein
MRLGEAFSKGQRVAGAMLAAGLAINSLGEASAGASKPSAQPAAEVINPTPSQFDLGYTLWNAAMVRYGTTYMRRHVGEIATGECVAWRITKGRGKGKLEVTVNPGFATANFGAEVLHAYVYSIGGPTMLPGPFEAYIPDHGTIEEFGTMKSSGVIDLNLKHRQTANVRFRRGGYHESESPENYTAHSYFLSHSGVPLIDTVVTERPEPFTREEVKSVCVKVDPALK